MKVLSLQDTALVEAIFKNPNDLVLKRILENTIDYSKIEDENIKLIWGMYYENKKIIDRIPKEYIDDDGWQFDICDQCKHYNGSFEQWQKDNKCNKGSIPLWAKCDKCRHCGRCEDMCRLDVNKNCIGCFQSYYDFEYEDIKYLYCYLEDEYLDGVQYLFE